MTHRTAKLRFGFSASTPRQSGIPTAKDTPLVTSEGLQRNIR